MNVIDALLGEHAAAKAVLDAVENHPEGDHLLALLAELLDTHAKIEEELLYNDGKSKDALPVSVAQHMKDEHHHIKRLLGETKDARSLVIRKKLVHELVNVVREHLHDEEVDVFKQVMGVVPKEKREALEQRWQEYRKVGK